MDRSLLHHTVQQRLQRLPKPFDNHYGVVPLPPPTSAIRSDARSLAAALEIIEDGPLSKWELPILALHEARSSCAIEGIEASPDDIFNLQKTGEGTTAAKQVWAYRMALCELIPIAATTGSAIFTLPFVQRIHAMLMADDPDYRDTLGELRRCVVWIGGGHISTSTWNPPPPANVEECLEENLDYMRNEGMQQMTQNDLARMAVAHAHFEAVHPFRDGNGRVGRLLLPLMMAASGHRPLFFSQHLAENVGAYYAGLRKAQQKLDWSSLTELFSEAILTACPA